MKNLFNRHRLARFHWSCCLILSLFFISSVGQSSTRMKVQLGGIQFKAYQLAIPDFANEGGKASLGKTITETLRNNFEMTGVFRVLHPSTYLEKAPKNGIEINQFSFEPWQQIGTQGLLKGSFQVQGNSLILKFRFYELGSRKVVLSETYRVKKQFLRWYLHLFSDKLYKYLTKKRGIFTTKIGFIRSYRGRQEVWMMDFDGKQLRRLTNNGSINALPAWSPNGKYIAYTSWKNRNPDLYLYNRFSGSHRKVSSLRGLNTGASWSPRGNKIAFSASLGKSSMNIYVINSDGSGLRPLTKSKWARNLSPSWSPDGKQIAFVSTRHGVPQIFAMNSDGSNIRQITTKGKYNQAPKWSPLGKWILFTGRDERNVFDLFLVSPTSREVKRLTQNQGNNIEAAWAPNGQNIVFSSTRSGVSKLFIMTREGKNTKQLTFLPGQFLTPTWSPWLKN